MTINKSQSQSFDSISVDLRISVFTYSQLYIALSRVTTVNGISVLLPPNQSKTVNIVYPEVLLQL